MDIAEIIERARVYTIHAYEDDAINLGDTLAAVTAERDALLSENEMLREMNRQAEEMRAAAITKAFPNGLPR